MKKSNICLFSLIGVLSLTYVGAANAQDDMITINITNKLPQKPTIGISNFWITTVRNNGHSSPSWRVNGIPLGNTTVKLKKHFSDEHPWLGVVGPTGKKTYAMWQTNLGDIACTALLSPYMQATTFYVTLSVKQNVGTFRPQCVITSAHD